MNTIYLDMDGVLANFDKQIVALFGKHFYEIGQDSQDRWNIISDRCDTIYRHLEKMPDADELVAGVFALAIQYRQSVGILTAIPKFGHVPNAITHKRLWVQERYPVLNLNFNTGPYAVNKQMHAKEHDVLIDDSELNIPQWNAAGGFGILHTSAADSLTKLEAFLKGRNA